MISVPTERPDADAPVPPVGTEQAAAEQALPPSKLPPEEPGVAEKIGDVVDTISDVTDVIGGILSLFSD